MTMSIRCFKSSITRIGFVTRYVVNNQAILPSFLSICFATSVRVSLLFSSIIPTTNKIFVRALHFESFLFPQPLPVLSVAPGLS